MGFFDWITNPFGDTAALNMRPTSSGLRSMQTAPDEIDYSRFTAGGTPLGVPGPVQYGTIARPPSATGGGGNNGPGGSSGGAGGAFTLADYLEAIGIPGGVSFNAPEAPDLTASVAGQFAPALQYLRKSIGRTKKEGKKASKNLKGIYEDMALGNVMTSRRIERKGERSTQKLENLYNRVGAERDRDIEREAGAISKRAKELGIRASVPASTQRLNKESAQQHRLFARQEGREVASSQQMTDNWSNFARSGAIGARMEGAQAQAELSQNVADLVFQLRGQIAQTQADKAAAISAAQAQEYGMAMDAAQAQMSAQQANAGLGQNYMQMMMEKAAAAQGGTGGDISDLQGNDLIAALLRNEARSEKGVNQADASAAIESLGAIIPGLQGAEQFNELGQSQGFADPTQQQFYQQIQDEAESRGISPELIRALMSRQVYEQYYG